MKNMSWTVVCMPMLFCGSTGSATAIDWPSAIEKVQQASDDYFEYAREVGAAGGVGSMYVGYEFDRHQCAILGRMLGLEDVIIDLETMPYPPMDETSDPQDLLVFATSLENWVIAAEGALEMDEAQRLSVWNLDCVGHQGIATEHYLGNSNPNAQFKVENNTLYVYGDIDTGFFDRLKNALDGDAGITEVALGSGGGSVVDALLAGREIRARGLGTTIYGNCFSACPLVFMGGTKRNIWASVYRLGFHQMSRAGVPVPITDDAYGLAAQYLTVMGVDTDAVLAWMLGAPPSEMFEPPVEALCAANVATWIQRVCSR